MNNAHYKIIFSGIPLPSISEAQLRENLARIFKISPEKARSMVGKGPIVIKKNATLEQAERYLGLLEKAGGVARKEAHAQPMQSLAASANAGGGREFIQPQPPCQSARKRLGRLGATAATAHGHVFYSGRAAFRRRLHRQI